MTGSLLTASDVAKLLGVPKSWVYEQSRAGRIPTVTLGRYRRYRREAIEAWLEDLEEESVGGRRKWTPKGTDVALELAFPRGSMLPAHVVAKLVDPALEPVGQPQRGAVGVQAAALVLAPAAARTRIVATHLSHDATLSNASDGKNASAPRAVQSPRRSECAAAKWPERETRPA